MRKKPLVLWIILSLSLGLVAHAHAENIVDNGDFEVPEVEYTETFDAGKTLGEWGVEFGSVDLIDEGYWEPANGQQSVDLSGIEAGAIYQDLFTVDEQYYLLRFALSGNPTMGSEVKEMEIWWGDTLAATVSFDTRGHSSSDMGWSYHQFLGLKAVDTTTRLRFVSLDDSVSGPALDDVSVELYAPPNDLWIQQQGTWLGDNVYTVDGTDQTGTATVGSEQTAVFQAQLENDGTQTGNFWIRGTAGTENWVVRYYRGTQVNPDREVTAMVVSERGWKRSNVPPGGTRRFLITVTPGPSSLQSLEVLVKAQSDLDPSQMDGIKAITTIPSVRPDLWIKRAGAWIGDDVYNGDGDEQTGNRAVDIGTPAVYYARMYNDGNEGTTFWIKQRSLDNPDWTVDYYWGNQVRGDRKVTAKVKSGKGWRRSNVPPGGVRRFLIVVTPNSGVSSGSRHNVRVQAESDWDATQRDTVNTNTRAK